MRVVAVAFFLSGAAGLMHQVSWAKLLVGLIGATAHAQAVVLAVFMGGLALGAWIVGSRVDRLGSPLRTYVVFELAIGVYCLTIPFLLGWAGELYVTLAGQWFGQPGPMLALRIALATVVVLLPATLMGGTVPLLARFLIGRIEDTQRQVARLYSVNSLGAVVGAGFAGFVTMPWSGVLGSVVIAAALNFLAGWMVWRLGRDGAASEPARVRGTSVAAEPATAGYSADQYAVTLAALALSGFAAMGYEVVFTRVITLAFGSATDSFTVMLMCFITGIALGSAIVSRVEVRRPLFLLGVSQVGVVLALLGATPLMSRLAYWLALLRITLGGTPLGFELYLLGKAALCLLVLLLPTTFLGICFPLVARIQARSPRDVGWRVGSTYAWNTVGNVVGVAVTSLVLVPRLGLLTALHWNLLLNLAAGGLLLLVARETRAAWRGVVAGVAVAGVLIYLGGGVAWLDPLRFAVNHLRLRTGPAQSLDADERASHPASSFAAWRETHVVGPARVARFFAKDDAHTTVVAFGDGKNAWLTVNTKPDASSAGDLDTQLLLAHAPLLYAPNARSLAVIGHGSGITAGSALRHPIERADVIEISRAVLDADELFAEHNHGVLSDPRVRVFEEDGQSFLRTVPRTYDVIVSEPSNPWIAGIGALFTVEFFSTVRSRLNPGGVFSFWFHCYEQSDAAVALVLRTLLAVFPHAIAFADNDFGNVVAVAAMEPLVADFASIEARFAVPGVQEDLVRLGVPNLLALLSHHRLSPAALRAVAGEGAMNTALRERLEHAGPRSFFAAESAYAIEAQDPLRQGAGGQTDILLDQYRKHRADRGRPVTGAEFEAAAQYAEAMGGYGEQVAQALRTRAEENAEVPETAN